MCIHAQTHARTHTQLLCWICGMDREKMSPAHHKWKRSTFRWLNMHELVCYLIVLCEYRVVSYQHDICSTQRLCTSAYRFNTV